ncbi:MAG: LysR family transcriptional regulator [Gammaproteobacteria bacterium]|nr:LysR family transcriptional regulator [Gammaproteobacteria bacterium]
MNLSQVPKLELRHLQMLSALATAPSLGQAADRLSITPSALTHRIREAERRVTAPLLVRERGRPRLTGAGQRLLDAAERCLRELDLAEADVAQGRSIAVEIVRIGASTLSGYEWLPGLLRRLAVTQPAIEVEVALDVSLDPVAALRERRIDLAILPAPVRLAAVRSQQLFRDEMVAVLPAGHARSRQAYLEAEELIDEPYVADVTSTETGREFERLFEPRGIRPKRVRRAGHTEAVIALVRAGFGLTILTRRTAAPYLAAGDLAAVRLTRRGLYLDWHAVLRATDFRVSPARTVARTLAETTGTGVPRSC